MKKRLILLLVAALLALAGCQPTASTPALAPTTVAQPELPTSAGAAYPSPAEVIPNAAYPAQTTPNTANSPQDAYPSPNSVGIGSAFPPTDGDAAMTRGEFKITHASLQASPDQPGQADLIASGSLPTSCHQLRVKVNPPDAQNKIIVEAYTVVEKDKACTQAVQPFDGRLATLGGYPSGKYSVVVNDQAAGELDVP